MVIKTARSTVTSPSLREGEPTSISSSRHVSIGGEVVRNVAKTALTFGSFFAFVMASNILMDFRVVSGQLPIDYFRPLLSGLQLTDGLKIAGVESIIPIAMNLAGQWGRRSIARGNTKDTAGNRFLFDNAGNIGTAAIVGLNLAMSAFTIGVGLMQ